MLAARYDDVADFYVAEVGDSTGDPATAALLDLTGDLSGRDVLDVACGQGRVSRELARRGARVIGVDLSAGLVERARDDQREGPFGITYLVGDAADIEPLGLGPFDIIVCNYGLSDIDDLAGAVRCAFSVLRPGGRFVFSILHPCFPGWGEDVSSSWQPGPPGYFREGLWHTEAKRSRIRRSVGANHRTISSYVNALAECGFVVDRLREPGPPAQWLAENPSADQVPTFLVIRSTKPGKSVPHPRE